MGLTNITAYIMYEEGPDVMEIDCMIEKDGNNRCDIMVE
jgi:hypothetical protein